MPEIAPQFAVDPDAEPCGPILPILAKLLIEIDQRNTDEIQRGIHPKAQEPGGSPQKIEVNT